MGIRSTNVDKIKSAVMQNSMFIGLIVIGIMTRIVLSLVMPAGYDLFFVIAAFSIAGGYALQSRYALLIPITIMLVSDMVLYTFFSAHYPYSSSLLLMVSILMLTGFMLMSQISIRARKLTSRPAFTPLLMGTTWGVLGYDIWTNFGWWLGPYYPNTMHGLVMCFTMAAPFMLWHMLSTLAAVPVIYTVLHWMESKHDLPALETEPSPAGN